MSDVGDLLSRLGYELLEQLELTLIFERVA
jgi:hypothetical protein